MTILQPPRFAGRLLMRLVPAQNHDAMIGWLIVRLHRGHGVTMVLRYCGVLWAFKFAALAQVARLTAPQPYGPSLWYPVVNGLIGESLFMILGGDVATRPSKVA